jgi:hypothetical protein
MPWRYNFSGEMAMFERAGRRRASGCGPELWRTDHTVLPAVVPVISVRIAK